MFKAIFLIFLLTSIVSCGQTEKPASGIKDKNIVENTAPKFSLNSDDSKTYLSSRTICMKDMPRGVRQSDCFFGNSARLGFYVEGENFVGIDKNTLIINQATINGKDITKNRKLEPNINLQHSPSVSDDGRYISWTVAIEEGYQSVEDEFRISGHVTAFKSKKLQELTSKEFDVNQFNGFKLGEVLVKGTWNEKNIKKHFLEKSLSDEELRLFEEAIIKFDAFNREPTEKEIEFIMKELGVNKEGFEELAVIFLNNLFKYEPEENEISLTIKTNFSVLEKIEVYSDGVKLDTSGSTWSTGDTKRTFNFKKLHPSISKIKIKVFYWQAPEAIKLNFDI